MSRFVSGGTIGEGASSSAPAPADSGPDDKAKSAKAAEWQAVQAELDAERQRREEHRRKVAEGGDKSLYEVLQENKGTDAFPFPHPRK